MKYICFVTAMWVVATTGCRPNVNATKFFSEGYRAADVSSTAFMPLILRRARAESKSLTLTGGMVREEVAVDALSPAEYLPAAKAVEASMARLFVGRDVRASKEVVTAMDGVKANDLTSAIRAVASQTRTASVLVVEINDFVSSPAGLDKAQASGRTNISLFSGHGDLVWSISAEAVKRSVGTSAAPTLQQFVEHVLVALEPEVAALLGGPT